MKKQDIINELNKNMLYNNIQFKLDDKIMDQIAIDVSRVADGKFTDIINNIKNNKNIKINSSQKEAIRKYFIGYPIDLSIDLKQYVPEISDEEYKKAYELIGEGFERKKTTMIDSLVARVKKNFLHEHDSIIDDYLEYIQNIQIGYKQLLILEVDADKGYSVDNIAEIILNKYDELSNFHHAIIIFRDGKCITDWSTIAKVALYMEQFKKEHNFNVFEKKNKALRIKELKDFLMKNRHVESTAIIEKLIEEFYDGVSYGFQFQDLFISSNGRTKVLVMQKVELDEEAKKCPSCLEHIVRGNSYPNILYKSFECQNPSCPSRSKIGRGKRYDLFSAKRQMMLERNSEQDHIDDETYFAFRRDIVEENELSIERLISLYSWEGDFVEILNSSINIEKFKGRNLEVNNFSKFKNDKLFDKITFIKLFREIASSFVFPEKFNIEASSTIGLSYQFNGNSTDLIPFIEQISPVEMLGGAVTSPPYYNAREYSQWTNLLCYLVDMMANAKAIYKKLDENGIYIYNIGDVVGQDNIYIQSNMSKRRQMLGFYSIIIFEEVGYKTIGNIIWDKGEVQSKRNSTPNHFSGYVKPINAYEHCLVFSKKTETNLILTSVKRIETVKKINSKGENTLGHTAPYPLDIAKLIIPFINNDKYVVDPFLGSGTTVLALQEEGYLSIGFELNKEYYQLAINRIAEAVNMLSL